jgi:dTDP-glucose 4,6-dehydratase
MFRPANPYAAAKAGGEAIGMAYANTYKLPITIANTMNLYGERQGAEKFLPLVIRRALSGEKVLIHADPSKTRSGTRFYIHCRNYASALAFLIERDYGFPLDASVFDRAQSGIPTPQADRMPLKIHVAGEREISNLDLAQMIASFVGKPLNYELVDFHSSRPGHDLRYALDDSKIREMGWKQPINIAHSLEKTVRWYLRDENRRWLGVGTKGA